MKFTKGFNEEVSALLLDVSLSQCEFINSPEARETIKDAMRLLQEAVGMSP